MKHLLFPLVLLLSTSLSAQQSPTIETAVAPFKIDARLISGLDLPPVTRKDDPDREYYQKRVFQGEDLSVFILSSETSTNELNDFPIDEFVYYLNGKAEIELPDQPTLTFLAGDYLFAP